MSFRASGALLLGVLLLPLAGCAALGRPATPLELSRLRAAAEARERAVESIQGLAELALRVGGPTPGRAGVGYSGRAVVVVARGGSFRVEALDPLGRPLLVVVAGGGRLQVYLPERGRLYGGRAERESVERWLGVPLSPEEVSAVLRGALPLLAPERGDALGAESVAEEWRLEVASRPSQEIWLGGPGLLPRRGQIGGPEGVEVRYGEFLEVGPAPVPGTIEVELGGGRRSLRLRYLAPGLRVNAPLPEGVFSLSPPPGVEVLPLEAAGAL